MLANMFDYYYYSENNMSIGCIDAKPTLITDLGNPYQIFMYTMYPLNIVALIVSWPAPPIIMCVSYLSDLWYDLFMGSRYAGLISFGYVILYTLSLSQSDWNWYLLCTLPNLIYREFCRRPRISEEIQGEVTVQNALC